MDAATATAPAPVLERLQARRRYLEIDGLRGWACVSVMLSHLFFGVFIKAAPPFARLAAADGAVPGRRIGRGGVLHAFRRRTLGLVLDASVAHRVGPPYRQTLHTADHPDPDRFDSCIRAHQDRPHLQPRGRPDAARGRLAWGVPAGRLQRPRPALVLEHYGLLRDARRPRPPSVPLDHADRDAWLPPRARLFVRRFSIRRRYTAIVFMLLICLGADSMLACFPIGMLCAIARARGGFAWLRRQAITEPVALVGFALALVIGTWCNRVWQGFLTPSIIAGGVAVVCVYASERLTRFFSAPLSLWLGQISFPIFLLQFPVIVSFTSGMALLAHAHGLLSPATIWLIVSASAALCLFISRLFRPVETWAARAGALVCNVMMRDAHKEVPILCWTDPGT
jgi:hypothetical protein